MTYNELMITDNFSIFQLGEECLHTREYASLFNMSYFGKFYISGRDATKACEWIFSNNMDKDPGIYMNIPFLNIFS